MVARTTPTTLSNRLALGCAHGLVGLVAALAFPSTSRAECSTDIGNADLCPPPNPPPDLPSAGGTFVDPTFGTEIIRVTDRSDGDNALVAYSYWNLFNVNSERFFIGVDGVPILYDFDGSTTTKRGPLFAGQPYFFEGLTLWSGVDPDILYGAAGASSVLSQYNVATEEYDHLIDIATLWPNTYIWQLSMSEDDNVFAFTIADVETSNFIALGAYDRTKNETYRFDPPPGSFANEAQVDKSGRWVHISLDPQSVGTVEWDLQTGTQTVVTWDAVQHAPGHYDQGYGRIVGADAWADQGHTLTIRDMSNPTDFDILFVGGSWAVDHHISWRNNDDEYIYDSTYTVGGAVTLPLENEILQIFLDGSGYRRLAHHRSAYADYADSPRAAVDRLGKYIIFNSNWDNSGHLDVFILKIPEPFQAGGEGGTGGSGDAGTDGADAGSSETTGSETSMAGTTSASADSTTAGGGNPTGDSSDGTAGNDGPTNGCGCRNTGRVPSWALAVILIVLPRRRARRERPVAPQTRPGRGPSWRAFALPK